MTSFIPPFVGTLGISIGSSSLRNSTKATRIRNQRPRTSVRRVIVGQSSANGVGPGDYGRGKSDTSAGRIKLMACDMDGTMLNSDVRTSERNIAAVKRLLKETDVYFVPATGKSRAGALNAMGDLGEYLKKIHPAGCPGVFLQGLIVYGLNGDVVYEDACDEELSKAVVELAKELNLTLIGYNRDSILCTERDRFVDLLPTYKEPNPEVVESWEYAMKERPVNKFIYMAEPSDIDEVRPLVAERIGSRGHLTQAQGNMLEVLPPTASKGAGVVQLLASFGIDPNNVLAIGDAENDLEMLEMVRYSCAVANALPSVKKVSKYADLSSNDDDGVAEAIERFILTSAPMDVAA